MPGLYKDHVLSFCLPVLHTIRLLVKNFIRMTHKCGVDNKEVWEGNVACNSFQPRPSSDSIRLRGSDALKLEES